jgi:hypothetical protein
LNKRVPRRGRRKREVGKETENIMHTASKTFPNGIAHTWNSGADFQVFQALAVFFFPHCKIIRILARGLKETRVSLSTSQRAFCS